MGGVALCRRDAQSNFSQTCIRVEQVWVPLPIHGDGSGPATATEIVDESGNACNVDISTAGVRRHCSSYRSCV